MIKLDGVWVGSKNRAVLEAEAAAAESVPPQEAPAAEAEVKPTRNRASKEPNGDNDVS